MNLILDFYSLASIIIIILSTFQTIVGVGILVLGTPILLLLGLEMVEVMAILLPLSIFNSLTNIFYFRCKFKKIVIDQKMRRYFFLICLPGIFLGLFILKIFNNYLNFNLLVSFVIWFFLIISLLNKKKKFKLSSLLKKNLIFITGIIHGFTNSGGSLLSILIVNAYNKSLNYIRYQIIFFYFFLALFHYISINLIFELNFFSDLKSTYIISLFVGVILGNLISNKVNTYHLKNVILSLAFLSSIFLILQA